MMQMTHEAPLPGRGFGSMPPPPGAVSGIGMRASMPGYNIPQYTQGPMNPAMDMAAQHGQQPRQDAQWFGAVGQHGYQAQMDAQQQAQQAETSAALAAASAASAAPPPPGAAGGGSGYSQTVYTVPPGSIIQAPAGYMPQQFGAPIMRTVRPGMIGAMAGMAPRAQGLGIQKESAKRVTVWNKKENRKISGNAAPMEKNLHDYLRKHPECEVYSCQDKESRPMDSVLIGGIIAGMGGGSEDEKGSEKRITIWNKRETRKISGNAAPLEKNLWTYLREHPEYEVYNGQDKRPEEYKRVWKKDGEDKETSPSMEILGDNKNGNMRSSGEFSFKDHFGAAGGGSWGADGASPGSATPWGIQLAGASGTSPTEMIPIESRLMSVPSNDCGDDMMMLNPSSLGSMGSAPTMGSMSMGSMSGDGLHFGSIGSSVGSLGFCRDGMAVDDGGSSMNVDDDPDL